MVVVVVAVLMTTAACTITTRLDLHQLIIVTNHHDIMNVLML